MSAYIKTQISLENHNLTKFIIGSKLAKIKKI